MKKRLMMQGSPFVFNSENIQNATILINRYPPGRQASALVPLLDLAQRQCQGWLPQEAMEYVAQYLDLSFIQVYEVATFYSMFNLSPVGKYILQVCTTTPCQLSGAEDTLRMCQEITGASPGHLSPDGLFSIIEVECLGSCIKAPVIQINDNYHENMDPQKTKDLLLALKSGQELLKDNLESKIRVSAAGTQVSKASLADLHVEAMEPKDLSKNLSRDLNHEA